MDEEAKKEELRNALDCAKNAGLMTLHGTVSDWGEAASCPAEFGNGPCECGYEEHNKEVEEYFGKLSAILSERGLI